MLRLALLAVVGRFAALRSVLMLVVTAVAVALALMVLAAPRVLDREARRADARSEILGTRHARHHLGYFPVLSSYRGESVTRVLIGDPSVDPPMPPGLTRIPGPGEVVVSPGLRDRMRHDPVLASWFAGDRVSVIADRGVSTRDELWAYVGASASVFDADSYAVGFGAPANRDLSSRGSHWYKVLGLALLVMLPALGTLLATTRIGADTRRRRSRALSVIAVPRWITVGIAVAEVAVPVAAGGIVGWGLFALLARNVHRVPLVERGIIAGDVAVPAQTALPVVLGLAAVGGAVSGASAINAARVGRLPRLGALPPRTARLLLLVFAGGVGLLAIGVARAVPQSQFVAIATVITALGIPVAVVAAIRLIGRLARWRWPLTPLLAFRRVAHDPGPAGAAVAGVAILAFSLTAAQPVLRDQYASSSWPDLGRASVLVRAQSGAAQQPMRLTSRFRRDSDLTVAAYGIWGAGDARTAPPRARVLIATCGQLAQLTDTRRIAGCQDGLLLRVRGQDPSALSGHPVLRSSRGQSELPRTSGQVTLPATIVPIDVAAVISPHAPSVRTLAHPVISGIWATLPGIPARVEQLRADAVAATSSAQFDVPNEGQIQNSAAPRWITLCVIIAALLGLFAATALALTRPRRSSDHALQIIAVSPRTRLVNAAIGPTLAALIGAGLALGSGLLAAFAYVRPRDEPLTITASYAWIALTTVLGGLALGLLSELVARTRQRST